MTLRLVEGKPKFTQYTSPPVPHHRALILSILPQITLVLGRLYPSFAAYLMPRSGVEESEFLMKQQVHKRACVEE